MSARNDYRPCSPEQGYTNGTNRGIQVIGRPCAHQPQLPRISPPFLSDFTVVSRRCCRVDVVRTLKLSPEEPFQTLLKKRWLPTAMVTPLWLGRATPRKRRIPTGT